MGTAKGTFRAAEMEAASSQPYSYTALATTRTIRVIVLDAASSFDDPLQCSLNHLEVEDSAEPGKEYDAISYCWGEPIFSNELLCDGKILRISPNVDSLLRHLRRSDVSQQFWIDGICINQQDLAEKSIQIILMRDIFFCAMRVHVWLGDATESTSRAFTLIRKASFLGLSNDRSYAIETSRLPNMFEEQALESKTSLLSRSWFTRRWILQEVALSHETIFHCGQSSMSSLFFREGLQALQQRLSDKPLAGHETLQAMLSNVLSVCQCKRQSKLILELILLHRSSKCLNEHDLIFSLLAMAANWPPNAHGVLGISQFVPSYNTSISDTYKQFAMSCVLGHCYPQILYTAASFPARGAPSWVPDFRFRDQDPASHSAWSLLHGDLLPSKWFQSPFEGLKGLNNPDNKSAAMPEWGLTVPTAEYNGFYILPDLGHRTRMIGSVGQVLPKDASRTTIIGILRDWLSLLLVQKPNISHQAIEPVQGYAVSEHSSESSCTDADQYYIKADAFGINRDGYIPHSALPFFFETITGCFPDATDSTVRWLLFDRSLRLGFGQPLTSDLKGQRLLEAKRWSQYLTQLPIDSFESSHPFQDDMPAAESGTEAFLDIMLGFAGGKTFSLLLDNPFWQKSNPFLEHPTSMLSPPGTRVQDVCLSLVGERYSAMNSSPLVLTPSGQRSLAHHAFNDKMKYHGLPLEPANGYRLLGTAYIPPTFPPPRETWKMILINA